MSTIADYSILTKAFLTSTDVDFSKTFYQPLSQGNSLRYLAVVPLALSPHLTTREAMNFDWTKLGSDLMWNRVSCRNANGEFIGNIVRVQPGVREGSIRLVAKVAVPAANEGDVEDIKVNTFVLLRTDSATSQDLPIAVATISEGYTLHKHLAIGNDPLDDAENANYVSFTINHLNGYTSVDFNPDAYATYDDVANALSRGIDGLHIAFDTASGDLKLLDKDGNVLDQANLPIKADVIIAEGEEGYKYVKTDVKQDIHAAKAWMPEGKTAWKAAPKAPNKMKRAALVMGKGSSRVFVSDKPKVELPISTKSVQFEHVVIGNTIYMVTDKNEARCHLRKVKGEDVARADIYADLSGNVVTLGGASNNIANAPVVVDVVENDGITYVLVEITPQSFQARSPEGDILGLGTIVTFGGSSAASRVFVDPNSGSYPISTESVQFEHVVTEDSTYMLVDKNGANCNLIKVKGKAEAQTDIIPAVISEGKVTLSGNLYDIKNEPVEVDVIKDKDGVTYVLVGTNNSNEFRALSIGGSYRVQYSGIIVTSEGSSTGEVLGIAIKGDGDVKTMYTFDEGAQPHAEITSSSGDKVRWLDTKPLTEVPNHTLKYGLEAFVWTVKDSKVKLDEPFFKQLNDSLLALGFHEGDDIALGTNLSILAPADPKTSPLNKVDADDYIHGKANKATREREVDEQRAYAKEELVAWNAQHPALTEDREHGTIIDSTGLDVRKGRIILGCGRVGDAGVYGIQMKDRSQGANISGSLDFTVSHTTGNVQFDENGHATGLTSSTLLSIEAGSYISGAPTCLILAKVSRSPKVDPPNPDGSSNPPEGSPVLTPVRMTAGFRVEQNYDSSGLSLRLNDDRDNILGILSPNGTPETAPAIIEVQAIYTHPDAQNETVPAQQMHTYIGEWIYAEYPYCIFLCNKIEEWMTAIDLTDPTPDNSTEAGLYVVIRVY